MGGGCCRHSSGHTDHCMRAPSALGSPSATPSPRIEVVAIKPDRKGCSDRGDASATDVTLLCGIVERKLALRGIFIRAATVFFQATWWG